MENWLRLADELGDQDIVFITGEAEEARGVSGSGFSPSAAHWHALPLTELATRLSTCRAFLGHDSGISHLAAACGVPSLLLFGPTEPAVWAPPQPWVSVLQAEEGDLARLDFERVKSAAAQVVAKS